MIGGTPDHGWLLSELRAALARLGSSPEEQVAYLRRLGVAPQADELALELDDVAQPAMVATGLLSARQREIIAELLEALAGMSGPGQDGLWTEAGVNEAVEWEHVRRRALRALEMLPASPGPS